MEIKNEKPENPSAFPLLSPIDKIMNEGMTLRDYFANSAMQGMCVEAVKTGLLKNQIAEISYSLADAMLKQREI